MKISDIQPIIDLLTILEPTHPSQNRKLSEGEIKDAVDQTKDEIGAFRVKLKPSECLQMVQTRKKYQAMIELAQLDGKDEI